MSRIGYVSLFFGPLNRVCSVRSRASALSYADETLQLFGPVQYDLDLGRSARLPDGFHHEEVLAVG